MIWALMALCWQEWRDDKYKGRHYKKAQGGLVVSSLLLLALLLFALLLLLAICREEEYSTVRGVQGGVAEKRTGRRSLSRLAGGNYR